MTADERSALKEAQRKAKRNSRIFLAIKIGFFAVFVAVLIFLIVRKGNEDGMTYSMPLRAAKSM